ncbi:hypothetical protein BJP36_35865 [Moorena producens JHB]|uniref:Uncharacterized protein n=1 Tax=Moorena producens (strain JHB) TaxID=1454205 RepID=A0A9Q9UW35_MOOP1|nr:hypothetical protein [Moorena producens]WAN69471.1 hypothetical protein BJP36_35865 [Moorena producens JHB]
MTCSPPDGPRVSFFFNGATTNQSLTLPDLKARGFLDQRAALNRRVPIFDAAKNRTILNQKTRQDQVPSQFTTDPEGSSP